MRKVIAHESLPLEGKPFYIPHAVRLKFIALRLGCKYANTKNYNKLFLCKWQLIYYYIFPATLLAERPYFGVAPHALKRNTRNF